MIMVAFPDAYYPMLQTIQKHIDNYGWAVQVVGGDADYPPLAYTIGLCLRGLPELIIIGLAPSTSLHILNVVAERMAAEDMRPTDDLILEGVAEPYKLRCRLLYRLAAFSPDDLDHFGMLLRYVNGASRLMERMEAVQLVWPDEAGRFHEEGGDFSKSQPLLQGARPAE